MLILKFVAQKEASVKYKIIIQINKQLPNLHFGERLNNRNNDQNKLTLKTC